MTISGSKRAYVQNGISKILKARICQTQHLTDGDERRRKRPATSATATATNVDCQSTAQVLGAQTPAATFSGSMKSCIDEAPCCGIGARLWFPASGAIVLAVELAGNIS